MRESDNLSELAELCWNLGELEQLKATDRSTCRRTHEHRTIVAGRSVAHHAECDSQLNVMSIRAEDQRACRKHHLWD